MATEIKLYWQGKIVDGKVKIKKTYSPLMKEWVAKYNGYEIMGRMSVMFVPEGRQITEYYLQSVLPAVHQAMISGNKDFTDADDVHFLLMSMFGMKSMVFKDREVFIVDVFEKWSPSRQSKFVADVITWANKTLNCGIVPDLPNKT